MSDSQSRQFRTTITIDTNADPNGWDLKTFYWAIENGEAHEASRAHYAAELLSRSPSFHEPDWLCEGQTVKHRASGLTWRILRREIRDTGPSYALCNHLGQSYFSAYSLAEMLSMFEPVPTVAKNTGG